MPNFHAAVSTPSAESVLRVRASSCTRSTTGCRPVRAAVKRQAISLRFSYVVVVYSHSCVGHISLTHARRRTRNATHNALEARIAEEPFLLYNDVRSAGWCELEFVPFGELRPQRPADVQDFRVSFPLFERSCIGCPCVVTQRHNVHVLWELL